MPAGEARHAAPLSHKHAELERHPVDFKLCANKPCKHHIPQAIGDPQFFFAVILHFKARFFKTEINFEDFFPQLFDKIDISQLFDWGMDTKNVLEMVY